MQSTIPPPPQPVRTDSLPQRRHRKMLKDGSSEVWPSDAESIFLDGLREYWNSPWANFSRGRSRWRNQYLVDYLKKNNIERSKKQVASHIQVLRNMWKGHPEFCLVAGPDELSEGSSTSDRHSPSRRSSTAAKPSPSPSRPRRASVSQSSPPSTPTSFESNDFPTRTSPELTSAHAIHHHPYQSARPQSLTLIKSEYSPSTTFDQVAIPSGLPSVPEDFAPVLVNRVSGLCLWTDGMDPKYIDVDALPLSNGQGNTSPGLQPGSPSSPVGTRPSPLAFPLNGIVRTSLRIRLAIPYDQGSTASSTTPSNFTFTGFSGAVSFAAPLATPAQCSTRVLVDDVSTSYEVAPLIPILEPQQHGQQQQQNRFVGLLPDSWLTRCHWLDANAKKTLVTQQVIVDGENIFVVIYDICRVHTPPTASPHSAHSSPASLSPASLHSASPPPRFTQQQQQSQSFVAPKAELTIWTKFVDTAKVPAPQLLPLPVTPPANTGGGSSGGSAMPHRYGGDTFGGGASAANAYLYSTGAALADAGQTHLQQHEQQSGYAVGGAQGPTHQRTASAGAGVGRQAGAGAAAVVVAQQQGSRTPGATSSTGGGSRQTTPTHTSYRPQHGHAHSSSISSVNSDLSSPTSPLTPLGPGFGSSSSTSLSSASSGSSSSGTIRSCATSSSAMNGLVGSYSTFMGRGFGAGMGGSGMTGYGGLYNSSGGDGNDNNNNTYLSGLDGDYGSGGGGNGAIGMGMPGIPLPGMQQHGSAFDPWTTSLLPLF